MRTGRSFDKECLKTHRSLHPAGKGKDQDWKGIMAKSILVVDDSASMLMSLKTTLTMNGFQVETAGDGKAALEKLKGGAKPDLILTDINMPNMGGLELIKNIRSLANFKFVPVLTLTTETDAAKRDEAKRSGATGWLVKPIDGNDLIKVIKRVLPGV